MIYFAIAEVDDGFTIVEFENGESAEDAAVRAGGMLVDIGPFDSYEDAIDALDEMEAEDIPIEGE